MLSRNWKQCQLSGTFGNTSKEVTGNHPNGNLGIKYHELPTSHGSEMGAGIYGEVESTHLEKSDRDAKHEVNTDAIMPPAVSEYLRAATPFELMGHPIACNPYSEVQYGGNVTACGESLVNQDLGTEHHARVVLPLEVTEEPVYVNAKQYHGILRRRQLRAKAVLEHKVVKSRKPYLHESRHRHAMRRARDNGGRFLNTKNDTTNSNSTPRKANSSGAKSYMDTYGGSLGSESSRHLSSKQIESSTSVKDFSFHGMQGTENFQWGLPLSMSTSMARMERNQKLKIFD